MIIRKKVILGSSPEYPLPSNTFATAYDTDNNTRLIILNAADPSDVSVTSTVVNGRSILSIVPIEKKD